MTNTEEKWINDKKEHGASLLSYLENTFYIHATNKIEKMYEDISQVAEHLDCYGETKEKVVANFCAFQSDRVEKLYGIKRNEV